MYEKDFFLSLCVFLFVYAAVHVDEFAYVCVFYINNSYNIYKCIILFFVDDHGLCELAFCHAYMYDMCSINCIAFDAELLCPI